MHIATTYTALYIKYSNIFKIRNLRNLARDILFRDKVQYICQDSLTCLTAEHPPQPVTQAGQLVLVGETQRRHSPHFSPISLF